MIVAVFSGELVIDEDLVNQTESEIRKQIQEYLEKERKTFSLDTSFPGGGLGLVLRKASQIPYGETRTYGAVADELDIDKLKLGEYLDRNPLPLIIPSHRVVGENSVGSYKAGREVKRRLLELERGNSD
jgi:methylated-DNA-[protein]-cysteine S-methyltransferase